jgi:hypothetical protein
LSKYVKLFKTATNLSSSIKIKTSFNCSVIEDNHDNSESLPERFYHGVNRLASAAKKHAYVLIGPLVGVIIYTACNLAFQPSAAEQRVRQEAIQKEQRKKRNWFERVGRQYDKNVRPTIDRTVEEIKGDSIDTKVSDSKHQAPSKSPTESYTAPGGKD